MNKTAKCVLIIAAIVLLALAGWIAAGPYMACLLYTSRCV